MGHQASPWRGCPIRTSADHSLLAAPRGFSQPSTSFIGSWCQGIHRAPLLARRLDLSTSPSRQDLRSYKKTIPITRHTALGNGGWHVCLLNYSSILQVLDLGSMGRLAAHSGQLVTFDQMLNHDHEFAPDVDKLTLDGPAPLTLGSDGKYPIPEPGRKKLREY